MSTTLPSWSPACERFGATGERPVGEPSQGCEATAGEEGPVRRRFFLREYYGINRRCWPEMSRGAAFVDALKLAAKVWRRWET